MTNIEQNTEQVVNAVSAASNGINWDMTIAIAALIIAIIAVIVAFSLYLKLKWFIMDGCANDNYGKKPRNMRDLIATTVMDSTRINNFIGKVNGGGRNIEISTVLFNEIVETVLRKVEKRMAQSVVVHEPPQQVSPTINVNPMKLYATSYNATNETFYEVNKQPSDQTIFEISVNPQNPSDGCFEVYRNAYEMVAECKDFLEYCCEVEGSGTSLHTVEIGKVTLNAGVWVVTKKLKVRFS